MAPGAPAFYTVRKVCVMGQNGDHRKVLGGLLDRDARHPQWSADSRTVYFLADDRGATHVYAARADGTVRQATDGAERLYRSRAEAAGQPELRLAAGGFSQVGQNKTLCCGGNM